MLFPFFLFVGYQPKGIEVQSFEKIVISDRRSFKDFDASVLQGRTVYSTIQCQNKAGLISSSSSDGVTIYDKPPSMATAVIRTLPLSVTEYSALDYYQSVTNNLRLVWSGVEDKIGVQQYKARQGGSWLIYLAMSSDECSKLIKVYMSASVVGQFIYLACCRMIPLILLSSECCKMIKRLVCFLTMRGNSWMWHAVQCFN